MMRSIEELPDIRGVHVMVRCSYDVPVENGFVTDPLRLDLGLKTVAYLSARGAKVILIGHIGRDIHNSLAPVFEYLRHKFSLIFVRDIVGPSARQASQSLNNGEILLLENLRSNFGEKGNDEQFVRELASMAHFYIYDDFNNAHRRDASVIGVPKFLPSYAGFQFLAELKGLTPALTPQSPSLAIIGGAKFETKAVLAETLLKKYDRIFVGGAIANDFFAAKGLAIGKSLVGDPSRVKEFLMNSKIILPTDVTITNPNGSDDVSVTEVGENDSIADVGPQSIDSLRPFVEKSRSILWNGPLGNFEKGFTRATNDLAVMIADARGQSIVGGGDTLSSIRSLNLMNKFTFVSAAGGAMLQFIADGTLPGIESLKKGRI